MDALKMALMKKMQEAKAGKSGPVPDLEEVDGKQEGDPLEKARKRGESDLAPELEGEGKEEGGEESAEMAAEGKESDLLQQILAALSDGSETPGRGALGLRERAAQGAKAKLSEMKK